MILNHDQIETTLAELRTAYDEQVSILDEASDVICARLSAAWECEAQRAYADAFVSIRERVLTQINSLIELFGRALEQSNNGLFQVNINLATMNSEAI